MGFDNLTPAALTYIAETDIYVNSGSGNDGAPGTQAAPLQSLEEALKNVWARRLNGDMTICHVYLSGASGDVDTVSPITYYWPDGYAQISEVRFYGWDDNAAGNERSTIPAFLTTGSNYYSNNAWTQDMTVYDGGSIITLTTDSGFTTPADFSVSGDVNSVGTSGSLSGGWFLRYVGGEADSYGYRAIAHNYDTDKIRFGGFQNGSIRDNYNWAARTMEIGKPGTIIDFSPLTTAHGSTINAWTANLDFMYLQLTASNNRGTGVASGRLKTWNSSVFMKWNGTFGGELAMYTCYVAPNCQLGMNNFQGRLLLLGCVFDGQFQAAAGDDPNTTFWRSAGQTVFTNYNIIQNMTGSEQLQFGKGSEVLGEDAPDIAVVHLTNSSGFTCVDTQAGYVKCSGQPVRLIGELNSVTEYSLALLSGSQWNWHTGSIVMQAGGTDEAKVSVNQRLNSGSADISTQTFILNYTSSISRAGPDDLAYKTFQTDYSASLVALQAEAD